MFILSLRQDPGLWIRVTARKERDVVTEPDAGSSNPVDKSDAKKKEPRKTIGVELTIEQYNTLREWGKRENEDRPVGWYVRKAVEMYIERRKAGPPIGVGGSGRDE
jgi:hypothetical protein